MVDFKEISTPNINKGVYPMEIAENFIILGEDNGYTQMYYDLSKKAMYYYDKERKSWLYWEELTDLIRG